MISGYLGKEVNYRHVEDRLGHDRRYSLDCSKLIKYIPPSGLRFKLETFLQTECDAVNNGK